MLFCVGCVRGMCPGASFVAQKRFIFTTFQCTRPTNGLCCRNNFRMVARNSPKKISRESPFNTPSQPRGVQNFLRLPALARSFPPSFTKNNRNFLIAQAENSARPSMVSCRILSSSKTIFFVHPASLWERSLQWAESRESFLSPSLPMVTVGRYT